MTDAEIIERYWQRDESAISNSSEKYGAYCRAVAGNILKDPRDLEECVNDTWLKAWGSIPPQRPSRLKLFFARITRNLAFSMYRSKTAEKRGGGEISAVLDELAECLPGGADTEEAFSAAELGRRINSFAAALPKRERDIFVRRYFFTESVRQIARTFGLTENNVSVILSRTREKLRKQLEKEGYVI
ncbi:MAG: RNA polymerase sigma factor [Oscillospiraceae bacterium]